MSTMTSELTDRLRHRAWFNKADLDIAAEAADALDAAEAELLVARNRLGNADRPLVAAVVSTAVATTPVVAGVMREVADALDAAEAKLAVIDTLHYRYLGGNEQHHCVADGREWPCPTHQILHPTTPTEDQ